MSIQVRAVAITMDDETSTTVRSTEEMIEILEKVNLTMNCVELVICNDDIEAK